MSLVNPNNKMSKSAPNHRSRILITSPPDEIRSRIWHATTDSINVATYDPETRPGVSNLLEIWSQCDAEGRSPADLAGTLAGSSLGDLKKQVGEAVVKELEGVKERYEELLARKGGKWIEEIQADGAEKARANAAETMRMVRDVVGLAGP
jgi:tryptophanyl-tRNA synthetase